LTEILGIDAASFQGDVDWEAVDGLCGFGAEKVTEGVGYTNPYWLRAKPDMLARARATGFVPLAYMFLDANASGAAQADAFAKHAGDLDGFGIVVDVERSSTGSPTRFQATRAVARLRKHYPHHPIGGYAPKWFTAGWGLKFFDWVWASEYVNGQGDPMILLRDVLAGWWDAYGNMKPEVLQFTSSAKVAGVAGLVDCSVYRGDQKQFRELVLPPSAPAKVTPPAQTTPPKPAEPAPVIPARHEMAKTPGHSVTQYQLHAAGLTVHHLVWLPLPANTPEPYRYFAMQLAGDAGAQVKVVLRMSDGTTVPKVKTMETGKVTELMPEPGWSEVELVELSRLDANKALWVTVRAVTW
jgi:lysozyme